jgi:hypothetical protein
LVVEIAFVGWFRAIQVDQGSRQAAENYKVDPMMEGVA